MENVVNFREHVRAEAKLHHTGIDEVQTLAGQRLCVAPPLGERRRSRRQRVSAGRSCGLAMAVSTHGVARVSEDRCKLVIRHASGFHRAEPLVLRPPPV